MIPQKDINNTGKNKSESLSVILPDGEILGGDTDDETFYETVLMAGVKKVRSLHDGHGKRNTVSFRAEVPESLPYDGRYEILGADYLVYIPNDTAEKKRRLEEISHALYLGLRIKLKDAGAQEKAEKEMPVSTPETTEDIYKQPEFDEIKEPEVEMSADSNIDQEEETAAENPVSEMEEDYIREDEILDNTEEAPKAEIVPEEEIPTEPKQEPKMKTAKKTSRVTMQPASVKEEIISTPKAPAAETPKQENSAKEKPKPVKRSRSRFKTSSGADAERVNKISTEIEQEPLTLRVTFSDGLIFEEKNASLTMAQVITYLGVRRITALNIEYFGNNLIIPADQCLINNKYQPLGGNNFIMSNNTIQAKKELLEEIAYLLRIDFKVEIIDNNSLQDNRNMAILKETK